MTQVVPTPAQLEKPNVPWFGEFVAIDYGAQVTFELPLGAAEIEPFRAWLSETTSGRCEAIEIGTELVEVPA